MEETGKRVGRILSANSQECVVSYSPGQNEIPPFGSMVRIPLTNPPVDIYGIVTDVKLEEDGFLRQIASSSEIPEAVIQDAQVNRNVPIVLRVLFLGYSEAGVIRHLLPPRPPVTLADIYGCSAREISDFTQDLGYLRLILAAANVPTGELLAVHIRLTALAHAARADNRWAHDAVEEVISLLRDDYAGLVSVLGAIGDADISYDDTDFEMGQ